MYWPSHHWEIFIIVLSQGALIFLLVQKEILNFITQILVILVLIGVQAKEDYVHVHKCMCSMHVKIFDGHKMYIHKTNCMKKWFLNFI